MLSCLLSEGWIQDARNHVVTHILTWIAHWCERTAVLSGQHGVHGARPFHAQQQLGPNRPTGNNWAEAETILRSAIGTDWGHNGKLLAPSPRQPEGNTVPGRLWTWHLETRRRGPRPTTHRRVWLPLTTQDTDPPNWDLANGKVKKAYFVINKIWECSIPTLPLRSVSGERRMLFVNLAEKL